MAVRPIIVVPGIKGTGLENIYDLPPTTTWSVAKAAEQTAFGPEFDQLVLNRDGVADEQESVVNRPSQLLVVYKGLAQYLRQNAGSSSGPNVPTYVFPYDWRYSIQYNGAALGNYMRRLQLKKLAGWDGKSFDFVCHSMGGLVLRAFLWQAVRAAPGNPLPVGRVVFIATPHLGSLDAVQTLISGEGWLAEGKADLRKLARTFPGVYDLLPRFGSAVVNPARQELDIFDIGNWQANIVGDDENDQHVLGSHLTEAKDRLNSLHNLDSLKGNILVIYGAKGLSALRTVTVHASSSEVLPEQEAIKNWYDFEVDNGGAIKGDGDDVVPVESAKLPGIPAVRILAADVGWLQRLEPISMHAKLPSLDKVQSIAARFLRGDKPDASLLPYGMKQSQFEAS
jgi:hypothetical protein